MKRLLLLAFFVISSVIATAHYLDSKIPRATATVELLPSPSRGMMQWEPPNELGKFLEESVLKEVATRLDLPQSEATLSQLARRTKVSQRRGTDLIDLTVKHESPTEAALIANTIVQVTMEHRAITDRRHAQKFLQVLNQEAVAQAVLTQSQRDKYEEILIQENLPFEPEDDLLPNLLNQAKPGEDFLEQSFRRYRLVDARDQFRDACHLLKKMLLAQAELRTQLTLIQPTMTLHRAAR